MTKMYEDLSKIVKNNWYFSKTLNTACEIGETTTNHHATLNAEIVEFTRGVTRLLLKIAHVNCLPRPDKLKFVLI